MKTTVCLVMIVKNESRVIERCLHSVAPFCTTWAICDTGSTDGTQEIVRNFMAGVPGELLEHPWIAQDVNRLQAITAGRASGAEYLLLIDADEQLVADDGFEMPTLTADCYELTLRYPNRLQWARPMIVRAALPWRFVGRVHPYLTAEGCRTTKPLPGLYNEPRSDGASWSDPQKYHKHVAQLTEDVAANPGNPRMRYYLAQSYRDTSNHAAALEHYMHRASMPGGWIEETWSAWYEAAKCRERLQQPMDDVVAGYLRAYRARPTRAEPLLQLARYLRQRGELQAAAMFAREAARLPLPNDRLFLETAAYGAGAERALALCTGEPPPGADAAAYLQAALVAKRRGDAHAVLKYAESAMKHPAPALSLLHESTPFDFLYWAHWQLGNHVESKRCYDLAAKLRPTANTILVDRRWYYPADAVTAEAATD